MGVHWLPSEKRWLADIEDSLIEGEILLVRAPRRWGLSSAAGELVSRSSSFSCSIRGSEFQGASKADVRSRMAELRDELASVVSREGFAQVVFDDFGGVTRFDKGFEILGSLYSILVDSDFSRDVGAVFFARAGEDLIGDFRGSPIVGRAQSVALPRISVKDSVALNLEFSELVRICGKSTWIARRLIRAGGRSGRLSIDEFVRTNFRYILESLPQAVIRCLAGSEIPLEEGSLESELRSCFDGSLVNGKFELAEVFRQEDVRVTLDRLNPSWPEGLSESVWKFAELIQSRTDAVWVDRYFLDSMPELRSFLREFSKISDRPLRLLSSLPKESESGWRLVRKLCEEFPAVEVRVMTPEDRRRLHDRHLVFLSSNSGFTLPPVGAIVGRQVVGSAVSSRVAQFGVDYQSIWDRSDRLR